MGGPCRGLLPALLMALAAMLGGGGGLAGAASPFSVVAYLPEWRYEGADFEALASVATHLVLFSLEPTRDGGVAALDRLPRPMLMEAARGATRASGCRLLASFGGNGRSEGFSAMARSPEARRRFVAELMRVLEGHSLDGVDYNWEYPGYRFGAGYLPREDVHADYSGLAALVKETRAAFARRQRLAEAAGYPSWYPDAVTLAYYPDGRQEVLLADHGLLHPKHGAHLLHAMAYDANSRDGHSPLALSRTALSQAKATGLPQRFTLGLPFYGRSLSNGSWKSYEDILKANGGKALPQGQDTFPDHEAGGTLAFNGVSTIRAKVRDAVLAGAGGVMVWEAGQDCRRAEVRRPDRPGERHAPTCPGDGASLLRAIQDEMEALGVERLLRPSKPASGHGGEL